MSIKHLRNFINDNCIVRVPPGYYMEGLPGDDEKKEWQFYLRVAIYEQNCLFEIVKWLYERHDDNFQYAAMESAGPPILSALKLFGVNQRRQIDGFAIRKDQKKYGLKNWFEGLINPFKPVIILDDMANSKSTIIRAAEICKAHGLTVAGARTIANKKDVDNVDGIPVDSIFSMKDFDLTWWQYYKDRPMPDIEEIVKSNPSAYKKRV